MMKKLIYALFFLTAASLSENAMQTDWSGGDGVPGPVTDWGNTYDVSSQIDGSGGTLRLTTILAHTVDEDFDGAVSVRSADVDGDGDMDVLGAAKAARDITWWENINGSGTVWTKHTIDDFFDGAMTVDAADVDGDGDIDVLGAAKAADDITWWENTNGSGTAWVEHTVDGEYDGALSVYATDVDGDGDMDVLGAATYTHSITWWENANGTGTVWIEHKVNGNHRNEPSAETVNVDVDFDGITSVYAADVNGDGEIDILGADSGADNITWWNVMDQEEGHLISSILDAGSVSSWETYSSNSEEPAGTSVAFQFRSSTNASSMGAWSDTIFSSSTGLSGILADSTRYLQYRVILETSDSLNTPVLNDLLFTYNLLGIEENTSGDVSSWALLPALNPSYGYLSVLITVPEPGMVQLVLYDIYGRIIAGSSQEFSIGTHSVDFNDLAEGVYFCVMRVEDYTIIERMTVCSDNL